MATLLMRPGDGGSSGDKKRRARKGKNAQKKQPQRGLGVAQLEKLRLQEQSLLCPTPPSYTLRLSATDSDHHMVRCDTDAVTQTVLSLTTSNVHGQAGGGGGSTSKGGVRGAEATGGTLSRLSAFSGHSTSQSCLSPHLSLNDHHMSKCSDAEAFHAAAKRAVASRALACLSQTSKFSSVNASFFSNVLTATQLQLLETQAQAQQIVAEERRAAAAAVASGAVEHSSGNATAAFIFPAVNNYLKEAPANHVNSEGLKLHPLFKDHVGASASIVRTNSAKELSSFQSYASQQAWPSAEKVVGRKRPWLALQQENSRHGCYAQALDLNAPVEDSDAGYNERRPVGPNQAPEFRVGAHYTTGIVRTALGNSSVPGVAKIKVCSSGSYWQDSESPSHVTAYFPEMGVYAENAIGFGNCPSQSSMIKDSCSSVTGPSSYFSGNRQQATCFKDNPESCMMIPSPLVEKVSICSNFLTLGISSSSYPDRSNGWNEPEESIQDNTPTSMNDVSRLKQQQQQETTTTSGGCEGDNHCSQVRISICTQSPGSKSQIQQVSVVFWATSDTKANAEVGGMIDLKGDPTQSLSLEYDHGGGMMMTKRNCSEMLLRDAAHVASSSHYNDSFPPSSLTPLSIASNNSPEGQADESNNIDYDPSTKSKPIVEDILDLRLKLAL
ncbi:unnamed protein product [Calypogeia fissa]